MGYRSTLNLLKNQLKCIDWIAAVSIVLVVIALVTVCTAYLFPIYPDEIQVRFWLSRLIYDFPEKISGAPPCLSTFFQPVPVTMYLPGVLDWLIHGTVSDIPELRITGVLIAILTIGGLAFYFNYRATRCSAKNNTGLGRCRISLYIAGFFIAIFSVGVLPIFLITNRGEQLILPSIIVLVIIFIISGQMESVTHLWKKFVLVILYFLSVSMTVYGHPKGLFFLPIFIIVGWRLVGLFRSYFPVIGSLALVSLIIVQSLSAIKFAFQCPEMPNFENELRSYSFDPVSLFYAPGYFFDQAYQSLVKFPKYLNQLGFQEITDAFYLPKLQITALERIANALIQLNFSFVFFALLITLPLFYFRKDVIAGRYLSVNLVLLILFICIFFSALFNLPKNWYDAGYLYTLLMIVVVFFIGENFIENIKSPTVRLVVLYLAAVAVLSQGIFIERYFKAFSDGYAGPGISISNYDSIKSNYDLAAASRACNIDPENSKKLVVDDLSYLFFRKSKWPMAISYVWMLPDDRSIAQFFSKVDSDGLVVRCTGILTPYLAVVKREGNICCIPKSELKNLPTF